ncbi:MAG: hypothetical protein LH471_05135 [Salinibacterium sp.]|nr:hypothetical protein [Salinibacterium sp.]
MVAHLLRLKLDILANTVRRSRTQALGAVIGAVIALALGALVITSVTPLQSTTAEIARVIIVSAGSLASLAFLFMPLAFGADDPLDPRRFTLLGLPPGRLTVAIAVAATVSIPLAMLTVGALSNVAVWSANPDATAVAVLSGILIIVTAVLTGRVCSAVAGLVLSSRRVRDAAGMVVSLALAVLAPLLVLLGTSDWESQVLPVARRAAALAAWTPWGAPWSAAGDVVIGRPVDAALKIVIAVVTIAVLAAVWYALVRTLSARKSREAIVVERAALGWFARLPATPGWAIAARSLIYWGRDPRYGIAVAAIPVVPIVVVVSLLGVGVPAIFVSWIPVPVMCLFIGWLVHNDVAHDNTAFWTHIVAEVPGVADRWGRSVPALLLGVPLVLIGSAVTSMISGFWSALPGLIGLSACLLLVALGISSVTSATSPYATVRPGDSPFAQPQPQSDSSGGSGAQAMAFFGAILLSSPVVFFMVLANAGSVTWYSAALGTGLGVGLVVFFGGLLLGGRRVAKRAPELLAFALRN